MIPQIMDRIVVCVPYDVRDPVPERRLSENSRYQCRISIRTNPPSCIKRIEKEQERERQSGGEEAKTHLIIPHDFRPHIPFLERLAYGRGHGGRDFAEDGGDEVC